MAADEFGHDDCLDCHEPPSAGAARAGVLGAIAENAGGAGGGNAWTILRADVDNSTWDGPAAMAACKSSDKPSSCFTAICAGKKDGDPNTEDAHALPHHKKPGDPPNHNGVANALARLDQTEGLTNKAAAKAHLEAHMAAINGSGSKMHHSGKPAQTREQAYNGQRHGPTTEHARLEPFRAHWEHREVLVNGKSMIALDGYASMTGLEYEMWDMFGPYGETIDPRAFDWTLSRSPDVAFLVNHKGLTMARTSKGTLNLDNDPRGLHSEAFVNPDRTDVRDLIIAIDDKNIDEMSFAFMLVDGHWSDDYEHYTITQVDIDRGDVSAVNYGANPYTSIGARARTLMQDIGMMPRGAQEAAYQMLAQRLGMSHPTVIDLGQGRRIDTTPDPDDEPGPVVEGQRARSPHGMAISLAYQMVDL